MPAAIWLQTSKWNNIQTCRNFKHSHDISISCYALCDTACSWSVLSCALVVLVIVIVTRKSCSWSACRRLILEIGFFMWHTRGSRRLDQCTDKINAIQNEKSKTKSKPWDNELKNTEWENFEILHCCVDKHYRLLR